MRPSESKFQMSAKSLHPKSKVPRELKSLFNLLVAYEDLATRNVAMGLYNKLAQALLDECDFRCTWWRFEHLRHSTLQQKAVEAALQANMIILSVHAESELSPLAKVWIETWKPKKAEEKSALVVLLAESGSDNPLPSKMEAALAEVAHSAKMDFFCNAVNLPAATTHLLVEGLSKRAHSTTPLLEGILQQKPSIPRFKFDESG